MLYKHTIMQGNPNPNGLGIDWVAAYVSERWEEWDKGPETYGKETLQQWVADEEVPTHTEDGEYLLAVDVCDEDGVTMRVYP